MIDRPQAAYIQGYADGNGNFLPNRSMTHAEMAVLLKLEPSAAASPTWTDVPASHWAYGAIQAASQK